MPSDTSKKYDVIVVGLGAMGCSTVYSLARRGLKVLGLEQWHQGHRWGSSHGETRILRRSLSEPETYQQFLELAYRSWKRLEEETEQQLFHPVGTLVVGKPDGWLVPTSRVQATRWGADLNRLESPTGFQLEAGEEAYLETGAGYLLSDLCMRSQLKLSRAQLQFGEPMEEWEENGYSIQVRTRRGDYQADSLVVTAGPWLPALFPRLGAHFGVERQLVVWFEAPEGKYPTFDWEIGEREFLYGIPHHSAVTSGFKVGLERFGHPTSPQNLDRSVSQAEIGNLRRLLAPRLPALARRPVTKSAACLYTRHPDELFVLGPHPEHPRVKVAGAFQGLGFKFSSAVGEVLADLVVEGNTSVNLDPFSPARLL